MIAFYIVAIYTLRMALLMAVALIGMSLFGQDVSIAYINIVSFNLNAAQISKFSVVPILVTLYIFTLRLNDLYVRQLSRSESQVKPPDHAPPPAIAECVWWLVLPLNRESIRIELEDEFGRWVSTMGVKRARRRYRLEVLRVAVPLAMQFIRRRFGGALEALGKRVSGKAQVSGD